MKKTILLFLTFLLLFGFGDKAFAQFSNDNLAILIAAGSVNNTTVSVVEINKTAVGQTAIQTINIPGTGVNAIRVSGSATSTLYAANSNDGSLFCFTGHNSEVTASNANTLLPRAVITINNAGVVSLATIYTGNSGSQTRCATTLDNTNFYIADQGGQYTNGAVLPSPIANIRGMKSFGGIIYLGRNSTADTIPELSTTSALTGGVLTGLPGIIKNSTHQDFYLISSGSNGTSFDILYVLSATSNTVGAITKYSLVAGTWVANGSFVTDFGGFGIAAEKSGTGAKLYITTGQGALVANSVLSLTDAAGYNTAISITNNGALYTAAAGTIIKGVAFAPKTVISNLSGNYYIPQGANPKGFATLGEAVTALNTVGATGTVNFLLDADTLRENTLVFNATLTATDNAVIKPAPGRNVVLFVNTTSPTAGNGAYLIGINSPYLTFDGSNNGTDTRNLTISTEILTPVVDLPITVNNTNADNVVLKNLIIKNIITGQTNFRYGAVIDDIDDVTGFRVENCQIGTPERPVRRDGLAPWGSAASTQFSFINNDIYCGTRGIATYLLTNSEIIGNRINILPTTAGATDSYNHGIYITGSVGSLNIENNVINCLEKTVNASAYLIGIAFAGNAFDTTDIIRVVNNMVNVGAANETRSTYGIGLRSAGNMGNLKIYYNTIVVNNTASTLVSHAIGNHTNGTGPVNIDLKDNILINNHSGNTGSSALALVPVTSLLTSNYNVLQSNQNLVNFQGTLYANLAAWQVTTKDLNSKSKQVNFVSTSDLHLAGASIGDLDLTGTPITGITTDIDGDTRTVPYMGADEAFLPGLAGTYYIGAPGTGPGGSNPPYATLKAACEDINTEAIVGNCTFYITSNLVEAVNVGLGKDPTPYTITFKPMAGTVDTILFTQVADNVGASGGFVLGVPDLTVTSATNYGLVTTNGINIDGSNTVDGNSRDLVFLTNTGIHANTNPIKVYGDVNNSIIKNIKVTTQQSTSYGVSLVVRNFTTNFVPDNITVENCEITNTFGATAQGLAITNSNTPTQFPTGIVFKNNVINARTRGIFLNYAGNTDIYGNEISISQTATGYMSYGIWGYVIGDPMNYTNIYNNKIKLLASANIAAGDYGITGIQAGSKGFYNIYNNMIYGFNALAITDNPNIKLFGIRNTSAAVTANIYFNSIYLPNINILPGTGVVQYAGIYISDGINTLLNNIVVSDEADFPSYCIYRAGALGTLTSNYNSFFVSNATLGNIGYFNTADTKTFADWKTASGQDLNSINDNPLFTSATDLHLSGISSPVMGKGVTIPLFTTDIDGETRDNPPEIGADEIPGVIPVEFVSFKASATGNDVQLNWQTASETNSAYFEVERKTANSDWTKVGKLNAAGTTTKATDYSFTDKMVANGQTFYRLRQIDFNGTFSFSSQIEVLVDVPATYELSQNYPNPFNPTSTIRYALPQESKVTLEVYTVLGELVVSLVNDVQPAGKYSVVLNGSKLASGTYIYRLVANETVITKKMVLIK